MNDGNISFGGVIFFILLSLKLLGMISMSWLAVLTSWLWAPILLVIFISYFALVWVFISWFFMVIVGLIVSLFS